MSASWNLIKPGGKISSSRFCWPAGPEAPPGAVAALAPAGRGAPATFRWPVAGSCAAPGMTGVPVVVVGGRFVWADAVTARLVEGRVAPGVENCGTVPPGFCGCAGAGAAAGVVAAAAG